MTDAALPVTTDPMRGPVDVDVEWNAAKDLYLSGWTAREVCDGFGFASSSFFKRAKAEGWLKRDQPRVREPEPPLDLDVPVETPDQAMDHAWRRAMQAMHAGCVERMTRWLRCHARLQALVETAVRQSERQASAAEREAAAHDRLRIENFNAMGPPRPRHERPRPRTGTLRRRRARSGGESGVVSEDSTAAIAAARPRRPRPQPRRAPPSPSGAGQGSLIGAP